MSVYNSEQLNQNSTIANFKIYTMIITPSCEYKFSGVKCMRCGRTL